MALFSIAEHAMASAASRARGEASGTVRKCFGCDGHAAHDGNLDHLWRNCPRKHVPDVVAAAHKRINTWYDNWRSASRDTHGIGASAFADSVHN